MTNHPNRSRYRYLKYCPRGFANEVTYFRVPLADVKVAEARFAEFEDGASDGYVGWTNEKAARMPGVAVEWADRAYVLGFAD